MREILTFLIISVCLYKSGLCKCPIIKKDETCDGEKVKITLSTKSDSTQRFVYKDFGNLWHLEYDPWAENKILIHAHDKRINDISYLNLIEDLVSIEVESINIFSVDYSYFFAEPCDMGSSDQASYIGKCVAELISHLREINSPVFPQFHAIGDTFGATVLHYSAKYLKEESFERITGFNPSYGSLPTQEDSEYLETKDAQFVDVWLSSTVNKDALNSSGHVKLFLRESKRTYLENYVESINSGQGFYGYKCSSYQEAFDGNCPSSPAYIITGENVHKELRGIFLVDTSNKTWYETGNMGDLIPISSSTNSSEPTKA